MTKLSVVSLMLLSLVILALAQDGRRTSARARWEEDAAVTLKGEIVNVLMPLATLQSDGREYTVHLGPVWYWRENDYKLETGAVEIRGEVEASQGEMHLYPYVITQGKTTITLARENGSPNWSNSASMMRGEHHGAGGGNCQRGSNAPRCAHNCCGN